MLISIKFGAINFQSGWTIVYIEGSQVIISKKILYFLSMFCFVLTNSAGPIEMPLSALFAKVRVFGRPVYTYASGLVAIDVKINQKL